MMVFTTEQYTRSVVRVSKTETRNIMLDIARVGTRPWSREIAAILTPHQACHVACDLIGHALPPEKVAEITAQIWAEAARISGQAIAADADGSEPGAPAISG